LSFYSEEAEFDVENKKSRDEDGLLESAADEEATGANVGPDQDSPSAGAVAEEGEGALGNSIEELKLELDESQKKVSEQQDTVLRAQADVQNIRRRAERDVQAARKFALEKFSSDLLPVVDGLERSLDSEADGTERHETIQEGVKLTLKLLLDVLKSHGVEQLDPLGEPFDPERHEAMSVQPSADMEPNSVLVVLQKGYALNGRLVRPAMVVISKAES